MQFLEKGRKFVHWRIFWIIFYLFWISLDLKLNCLVFWKRKFVHLRWFRPKNCLFEICQLLLLTTRSSWFFAVVFGSLSKAKKYFFCVIYQQTNKIKFEACQLLLSTTMLSCFFAVVLGAWKRLYFVQKTKIKFLDNFQTIMGNFGKLKGVPATVKDQVIPYLFRKVE